MPYLNWSHESVDLAVGPHAQFKTELKLGLTVQQIGILHLELQSVLTDPAAFVPELRHALPQGWTLFWKKRPVETRMLLAHPEKDEWVATLALHEMEVSRFLSELQALSTGGTLALSQVGQVGTMSNVEVILSLK